MTGRRILEIVRAWWRATQGHGDPVQERNFHADNKILGIQRVRRKRLPIAANLRQKFVWTDHRPTAVVALLVAACWVLPSPANAQIYTWRDANGTLVLSNRKPTSSESRTYAVPSSTLVRTTRYAGPVQSRRYDDLILEHSRLNNLRPDLVRAVMQVESGFNPRARSPKGALGLMQLMPATIQQFGVHDALDPSENVRAGAAYLRQLLDRFGSDETLALAAYNAGPEAVNRHGQAIPPFRETQAYVLRVSEAAGQSIQARGAVIYRSVEVVDGRAIPRYSDRKPANGLYEQVH